MVFLKVISNLLRQPYNLQGQKLWQQEVDQVLEQQVSLQVFAKGIYLLQYQDTDGNQISKRVMKL